MSDPVKTDELSSILGFNPSKPVPATKDALGEVLGEIREERAAEAKVAAKKLLTEAAELHKKRTQLEREFRKGVEQIDKNLNKLVGQIKGVLNGRPEEKVEEPAADAPSEG